MSRLLRSLAVAPKFVRNVHRVVPNKLMSTAMWIRRFKLVPLFLLLGALANLAVAWGFAYWTPMPGDFGTGPFKTPWSMTAPPQFPAHAMSSDRWLAPGVHRIDQRAASDTQEAISTKREANEVTRTARPADAITQDTLLDHVFVEAVPSIYEIRITQAGWPFIAFEGARFTIRRTSVPVTAISHVEWAIEVEGNSVAGLRGVHQRLLPLRPAGSGFAFNSILFAVMIWMMWAAPMAFLHRCRRLRIGRCATCGYDLRGAAHERCPECGAVVSPL